MAISKDSHDTRMEFETRHPQAALHPETVRETDLKSIACKENTLLVEVRCLGASKWQIQRFF